MIEEFEFNEEDYEDAEDCLYVSYNATRLI
jgi:hypothetical protein